MRSRLLGCCMILAALLAGGARPAAAQTTAAGNIEGVVTDTSGGVLPGATVVVRNVDTNVARETTTDAGGRYRAAALQPGTYEVAATLTGLQASPIGNVQVQVGQTVTVDVQMRAAGVTEQVTVTSDAPIINTIKTDVSSVVGERAIANLPINGRRWENFVLLGPGVTNDGNFGLVSYRGISGLYNNNTVDGVDNNQAFFSEARGRTRASYTISQAAIREFQVGVSNFSAEFGRAAGGTVNAVTKSGTNVLHGEGFYFIRDDALQAREPFATFKPDERRQQFGVSAGGPLRQNKLFYFVNYDQQLRDFPGFVRTSNVAYLDQTCNAPGCAATREFFNSISGFFDREGNNRIFLGKVDAALNPKHNLSVQYNVHRWKAPNGIQTQPILVGTSNSANGTDKVKTDFAVVSLNSALSNRWLNEFRAQIGRDFESQEPNDVGPGTTVTDGISFGMPNFLPRPKYPDERRYQFVNNISFFTGPHSLKAGLDINYVREGIINLFQGGGVYTYPNLEAMASDCPPAAVGCTRLADANPGRHYSNYIQTFDLRGLAGDAFFTTTDYNFFVQDTWTVNKALTLMLGLRYETQRLPQPGEAEVNGIVLNGNPAYPQTMSFNQDGNNWGPRVGFTYTFGDQRDTIVRGGYGLYYGRTSNSVLFSALTSNAVTFATFSLNPTSAGAPTYPNVLSAPPTAAGSRPMIQFLSPGIERPEINMADVAVERQIGRDMTVSASYLYSSGSHLPTFIDRNLPDPSAEVTYFLNGQSQGTFPFYRGLRPDANINAAIEVLDSVESTYHGLVLQANKRFSDGLLFNVNYTLSKADDTGQNSTTFISNFMTVVDPNNLAAEDGISNFDRRHRFVASWHYAPTWSYGVQVGGVVTLESGLPVDPTISGSVAGTGAISTVTGNGAGGSFRAQFLERNSFRQEGRQTLDLRLSREFALGQSMRLIALWEAFNVFNTVNYTSYSSTRYNITSATFDAATNRVAVNLVENAGFLRPTAASNTLWGPRDMQLGFKLIW
jgi:Carboxypeptidase regulatory-like domain/TonB dependent receptor-like, beta-barrel